MDDQITEQIEYLLAQNGNSGRLARQLITLVGFVADGSLPDAMALQMASLSRQVLLKDIFDALISSLDVMTRSGPKARSDKPDEVVSAQNVSAIVTQIEAARLELAQCDPVNYAECIAWIMGKAKERKLLPERHRRR